MSLAEKADQIEVALQPQDAAAATAAGSAANACWKLRHGIVL